MVNNQVQQQNIPTSTEFKHHSFLTNKLFLITLVILILFTLVYVGIYLNLNSQLNQITKQNQVSQITPALPSPTPDPTANWKTYSNKEFGFEMKYPSKWRVYYDDAQKIGRRIVKADGSIKILGLSEFTGYSDEIDISAYKDKISTEFILSKTKEHEIYNDVSSLDEKPMNNCKECSVTEMILKAKSQKSRDLSAGEGSPPYTFAKIFYISVPRKDFSHIEITGIGLGASAVGSSRNFSDFSNFSFGK